MIPWQFAVQESTIIRTVLSRKSSKRDRPQRVLRAYLTACPGIMRHILENLRDAKTSPRYGMARQQQLSTGHVWALQGTYGSRDMDHA